MKELQTNELVQETKELLLSVKRNYLAVSANVFRLYEAWTGSPDQWCDFYEQELELSKSQVSKMRKVGEFVLAHGLLKSTEKPAVGYEALYLSINRHEKDPEQNPALVVAEAATWSKSDFRDSRKEECKTPDFHLVCTNCWSTKEKHA